MRAAGAMLAASVLCTGPLAAAEAPRSTELAPGLFLVNGLGEAGNVVFLVTTEGLLVVDSGENRRQGDQVLEAIREHTPEPVRDLVLTHFHADHTFGVPSFPESTQVIGQRGLGATLEEDRASQLREYPPYLDAIRAEVERKRAAGDPTLAAEEARLARNLEAFEMVTTSPVRPPDLELDGALDIRLGGETVELRSAAPSHTRDSVVVYFPALRAAHLGDLLFNGSHAFVDPRAGADTAHWIKVLEAAKSRDLEIVIPGHGAVGGPELLDAQIGYLRALRREVAAALAAGATLEQATETVGAAMRAAYPGYDFEDGLPYSVSAVWAELQPSGA